MSRLTCGNWRSARRTGEFVRRAVLARIVLRGGSYERCCSIFCSNARDGNAPTSVSTWSPSLKNRILGIERTLKRIAVAWLASTSTFTIFSLPLYLPASWSMIGATMWHGPHQVAQKSTTASPLCCSTSAWNVESVTFTMSLHAPSITVNLTFYELVRRSHRHRGHEHHRIPGVLSRRPGPLARTPRNC